MLPHSPARARRPAAAMVALLTLLIGLTGVLTTALPASAAGVNLHTGSTGAKVRLLETRLHTLGLLVASAVDRHYRAATVNAVKRFQRREHLPVTGRVNTRTWNLVARDVARKEQAALGPAPAIIGHRGATRPGVAEDTLQSLKYAHGWADVLEFDLHLTSDHHFVLMHDETLNRTTNCTGLVASRTLAYLQAHCKVDGSQPIPTWDQVAAYAGSVSDQIAPELKDEQVSDADMQAFVDQLDNYDLVGRTWVQSLTASLLTRVKTLRPALRTVLISKDIASVPRVKGARADVVAVRLEDTTAPRVKLYKDNGIGVWLYTASNEAGLRSARVKHATAIVTDIPRQARNYYHP